MCRFSLALKEVKQIMMDNGGVERRVEIGKDFELQYIAEKAGIRIEQARRLMERFGNDREAHERAARLMKSCPASQTPPAVTNSTSSVGA